MYLIFILNKPISFYVCMYEYSELQIRQSFPYLTKIYASTIG